MRRPSHGALPAGLGGAAVAFLLAAGMALGGETVHVIDGDTLLVGSEKVRIANLDAPEIFSPACAAERDRGFLAAARLVKILDGGNIAVNRTGRRDRYRRALATVKANGRDVAEVLIAERLARPWTGRKGSWC